MSRHHHHPAPAGVRPAPAPAATGAAERQLAALRASRPGPGEASHFYLEHHFGYAAVKVLPGEYAVSNEDIVIMTVLGSCVAACLWDPITRIGGMNHFMLPEGDAGDVSGRYGAYAMELLVNALLKRGASRGRLQAKVFGGGQVMENFQTMNVGERNAAFVVEYLKAERITLVASDVLSTHARKVCFFPATGRAMVRRLTRLPHEAALAQERRGSADRVARSTAGGSVDLF